MMREIEHDTLSRYGFIPDLGLSTFKNVYNIIGNMPCSHYFSCPNNLAFDVVSMYTNISTDYVCLGDYKQISEG